MRDGLGEGKGQSGHDRVAWNRGGRERVVSGQASCRGEVDSRGGSLEACCVLIVCVELDTRMIGVSIHRLMNAWFTR